MLSPLSLFFPDLVLDAAEEFEFLIDGEIIVAVLYVGASREIEEEGSAHYVYKPLYSIEYGLAPLDLISLSFRKHEIAMLPTANFNGKVLLVQSLLQVEQGVAALLDGRTLDQFAHNPLVLGPSLPLFH